MRSLLHDFHHASSATAFGSSGPARPPNGPDTFRTGVEKCSIRSDRRDQPGRVTLIRGCVIFRIAPDVVRFRTELDPRALIASVWSKRIVLASLRLLRLSAPLSCLGWRGGACYGTVHEDI